MTESLSKAYEPADIEEKWYSTWEEQGFFRATPAADKKPFTIVIPPPNVTGSLHMGHAFEHTLQDFLVRRARMRGFETLWLPGTDHAGIATQNVVERELKKEGTDRHALGREAFVERVWSWREQYGDRILLQMRRLGDSCDWERERFTMDEGLSRAVRTVFVRWFEDGLIYRGNRIINWCPRCNTALSDIEVVHEEVAGELVTFTYRLSDGSGAISVATTRIETMLGDSGIAVHPEDERYTELVGKTVAHPFFPTRHVPIVADEAVDPEFGTGAVKVTPAHDPTDFEIGERHELEQINILDENAHLNENGGPFAGLDRYEARGRVLDELDDLGLIEKIVRPYVHSVGHCYRCGTEIEPWLSEQWFVEMGPLAGPAIEAVRSRRIKIEPQRFEKSYLNWMDNIRDWCISRQIWWGHRIPVWYCDDCGATFASLDDPTECKECRSHSIHQDTDVLDTWFSSQLWPFSTLGWPEATEDLAYFYPTTVIAPGYEILYLWVARMIMSSLYLTGDIPFERVLVHGIVRDSQGQKMSKSLGNVIDPLDMIDRYGADALRFSLASAAVPGADSNLAQERIEGGRNFANKLWNASRFVLMSLDEQRPELTDDTQLRPEDRWILSRLDDTIAVVERLSESANLAEATRALHRFTWSEFCDWYIELSKLRATHDSDVTKAVLTTVLDNVFRLLHPVMPFITEELYSKLFPGRGSVMVARWPVAEGRRDPEVEQTFQRFTELITSIRRLKVEHGIAQNRRLDVRIAAHEYSGELEMLRDGIVSLARLGSLELVDELSGQRAGSAGAVTSSGIEFSFDLAGMIDVGVENERLQKELARMDAEVHRSESKLVNEQFVSKAPAAIVEKERSKLEEARSAREKLRTQIDSLPGD
jgi:valyl-tRNA synthetase